MMEYGKVLREIPRERLVETKNSNIFLRYHEIPLVFPRNVGTLEGK
jgi:hypothetical protein